METAKRHINGEGMGQQSLPRWVIRLEKRVSAIERAKTNRDYKKKIRIRLHQAEDDLTALERRSGQAEEAIEELKKASNSRVACEKRVEKMVGISLDNHRYLMAILKERSIMNSKLVESYAQVLSENLRHLNDEGLRHVCKEIQRVFKKRGIKFTFPD